MTTSNITFNTRHVPIFNHNLHELSSFLVHLWPSKQFPMFDTSMQQGSYSISLLLIQQIYWLRACFVCGTQQNSIDTSSLHKSANISLTVQCASIQLSPLTTKWRSRFFHLMLMLQEFQRNQFQHPNYFMSGPHKVELPFLFRNSLACF